VVRNRKKGYLSRGILKMKENIILNINIIHRGTSKAQRNPKKGDLYLTFISLEASLKISS
jgi:hypothetical protein